VAVTDHGPVLLSGPATFATPRVVAVRVPRQRPPDPRERGPAPRPPTTTPSAPEAAAVQDGLGRSASRSATVSAAGQLSRFVIQTASIVLLARLLTPSDYGVLAIAVAVSGLGDLLRDFGLANASVQARILTVDQRSNLFWINTAVGAVMAVALALLAPVITPVLRDPRLAAVLPVLALGFLVNGIATQPRAWLVREMRFVALNVIDTLALLIGTATGVVLAIAGAGYWSLIFMLLAQGLAAMIASILFARWLPGLPNRRGSVKDLLSFGVGLFGSQLLNYATRNANTFAIGITLGAVPLGLYNRAYQLLNLPLAQLQAPATQVALPTLSRLQDQPERYDRFLIKGQSALLHITTAILALSGAQAVAIFGLFLGRQWIPAAPTFQILALAGFTMVANYATYWVFLSLGLTRTYFRLSLITQTATIGAVLFGTTLGLQGIVVSFAVVNAVIWPFTLWWLSRVSRAPVTAMFLNASRVLLAYGVAGMLSLLATQPLGLDLPVRLGAGVAVFVATVAVWFAVWRPFRHDLMQLGQLLARVVRRA